MSQLAARVLCIAIWTLIVATGLGAVAFVLLGGHFSLALGGLVSAILGTLYVIMWLVYSVWA